MTVPALDTSFIGTFAYIQPAMSIQLADALPYFHAYQQYPEYVDGVMRIWDTGSESPAPNNYCDVYVRIRTDGWMMAFFPDDAHQGLACWSPYDWVLGRYLNRGDLLWWGHRSDNIGNPTTNATRLGRALAELWEAVKTNSDNPTYVFDYADVGYYDYEYTTAAKIYVFGKTIKAAANTFNVYFYFTTPVGTDILVSDINYGYRCVAANTAKARLMINQGTEKEHTFFNLLGDCSSNGFISEDIAAYTYEEGVQNTVYLYVSSMYDFRPAYISTGIVILADG